MTEESSGRPRRPRAAAVGRLPKSPAHGSGQTAATPARPRYRSSKMTSRPADTVSTSHTVSLIARLRADLGRSKSTAERYFTNQSRRLRRRSRKRRSSDPRTDVIQSSRAVKHTSSPLLTSRSTRPSIPAEVAHPGSPRLLTRRDPVDKDQVGPAGVAPELVPLGVVDPWRHHDDGAVLGSGTQERLQHVQARPKRIGLEEDHRESRSSPVSPAGRRWRGAGPGSRSGRSTPGSRGRG